jgi:hypothetical protein
MSGSVSRVNPSGVFDVQLGLLEPSKITLFYSFNVAHHITSRQIKYFLKIMSLTEKHL